MDLEPTPPKGLKTSGRRLWTAVLTPRRSCRRSSRFGRNRLADCGRVRVAGRGPGANDPQALLASGPGVRGGVGALTGHRHTGPTQGNDLLDSRRRVHAGLDTGDGNTSPDQLDNPERPGSRHEAVDA